MNMNKYIIGIDGMGCGACEAHVQDIIRRNFVCKKIKASHIHNNVIVITELNLAKEDFEKVINPTGYIVTSFERSVAIKKLFGWR